MRANIFAVSDSICLERAWLVTEAYRQYEDQPVPIKRALAFSHILAHMSLDLRSNPVFAGNTSSHVRAWMLLPEYGFGVPGQAVVENPRLSGLLDGEAIPSELREYWRERSFGGDSGWGHLSVDNERLLQAGLNGILAEIEGYGCEGELPKAIYRRAMGIAVRGVIAWAERYATAAEAAAQKEPDPFIANLLRRVGRACRQVPAGPPRDLFEALQSLLLVHLALHIEGHGYSVSIGLLDRLLAPYAEDPEAVELIAAWMLKLSANSVFGSHSKTQPLTIGGRDKARSDRCNAMTMKILEACELARIPDPTLFLRWHKGMDIAVKARAVEMLGSGLSFPLLVGDEQTMRGLVQAGISPEDAADYVVIGCNELGIPGRLIWLSVLSPEIQVLRRVLMSNMTKDIPQEAFLDDLEKEYESEIDGRVADFLSFAQQVMETVPTPFTSALMRGCIRAGVDHFFAGVPYTPINLRSCGFTNVVNSLAAIDEVVYSGKCGRVLPVLPGQKLTSLPELASALEHDFVGMEHLRTRLLYAPKWGNDDERADRWARTWLERRDRARRRVEARHSVRLMFELVVRSLHHLEGKEIGATPDGRLAGEPLADSVGAQLGTARNGVTALLTSVWKMNPGEYWTGGYNFNLTLPLARWKDQPDQEALRSMVDVFFARGGQELQINSLDPAVLREARDHPALHPDLIVRIAGFNARYIDLSALEQDELIRRAEVAV
jgi:formate C-acetyltransferase